MAIDVDWKDLYKAAKKNVKPAYKQIKKMDVDDWLASVGLEKRNVAADVFGALGLIALGCGIGFAAGLLFAPKKGEELRRDVNEKLRSSKFGEQVRAPNTPSGYAS